MRDVVRWVCDEAKRRGAAFADARAGETVGSSILLQDGRADKLSQYIQRRLGVRVLLDGAWGFASSEDATRDGARQAVEAAIDMARASAKLPCDLTEVCDLPPIEDEERVAAEVDPRSVAFAEKMAAMRRLEETMAQVAAGKAVNTVASYSDSVAVTYVANTRGTLIFGEAPRVWMSAGLTVQDGGLRQRWGERKAARCGYELVRDTTPDEIAGEAARIAVSLLSTAPPPSGKMPVVFHPSVTGLFTHEAIGHNAEADLVLAGESIIEGKLGQRIASECVTIVDDSDRGTNWGAYKYDSEGTPARERMLIDKGILVGLMHSLTTAPRFGVEPTGSARAQDAGYRPIVRMSNTYIKPAEQPIELADMIRDIDVGLYVKGGQSGYVMCEKGQFTCRVGEGWMIRDGELAEHVRDVCVNGMTLETLHNIDLVGSDFTLEWPGMCGKNGQGMPNNCGGPHIRITELVVGGLAGV